jgi:hypothetical protein
MKQTIPRNAGPARGAPAGQRSRVPVILAAVAACFAIGAAILVTNNDDLDAAAPKAAVAPSAATFPSLPATARSDPAAAAGAAPSDIEAKTRAVLAHAEHLDRTVWAKEVEAQRHEEFFIRLWDDFRAAEDKFAILERAEFETMSFGAPGPVAEHDWGVRFTRYEGEGNSVDLAGWRALLAKLRAAGYRPTELEFHQSAFEHEPGQPARSVVATVVHVVNDQAGSRQAVRCKLNVEWAAEPAGKPDAVIPPRAIRVSEMTVGERTGAVAFEPVPPPSPSERGYLATQSHFVLVYDLDGDGLSEILLPSDNLVLRNRGGWRFDREAILSGGDGDDPLAGAVIADFDGDGLPDLLCSRLGGDVYLVPGTPGGRFSGLPAGPAVTLPFKAESVSALTAGDIDGDGDLDAWFGQYKPPYARGQMPTPYYDANDGHPAALLLNDGTGRFTDVTEAAGLAAKRHRRTLAGSLVDLDDDGDLDLLVNSDFAGLDIYYNDGKGHFSDVTTQVVDERHNFGMGHTFADFNLDGRTDMYTIGMSSTTARRLTAMGAGLKEFPEHQAKRPQMGYGNRMFLAAPAADAARADGAPASAAPARFVQPPYKDDIARTGWSWGTTSPDFDNDGDPDLFIGNGMASGTTCRDYCTTFWRRDIYLGSSREDAVMQNLFSEHSYDPEESWNGFEHDVLYMNENGRGFVNVAHLVGVAFEFDARNVLGDDFDGDGKVDLVVIERHRHGAANYLHLLKNAWPTTFNWVGVRLAETRPGFSPAGAEVRVLTGGEGGRGVQVGRIVTGDSYQSQHAAAKHFGLGVRDKVDAIEVTWPNGEVTRVENPPANRWHVIRPDGAPKGN